MKKLYAPWRSDYTGSTARAKKDAVSPENCVFCIQFKENKDDKYYILKRFEHHAVLLNRYPYNAGHMMIIPFAHVSSLENVPPEAQHELIELITVCTKLAKEILGAQGVNIGINLGRAAGAGMPAHLHTHILPRWIGDTNFLPTLGEVKAVSFDLDKAFNMLKPPFETI